MNSVGITTYYRLVSICCAAQAPSTLLTGNCECLAPQYETPPRRTPINGFRDDVLRDYLVVRVRLAYVVIGSFTEHCLAHNQWGIQPAVCQLNVVSPNV